MTRQYDWNHIKSGPPAWHPNRESQPFCGRNNSNEKQKISKLFSHIRCLFALLHIHHHHPFHFALGLFLLPPPPHPLSISHNSLFNFGLSLISSFLVNTCRPQKCLKPCILLVCYLIFLPFHFGCSRLHLSPSVGAPVRLHCIMKSPIWLHQHGCNSSWRGFGAADDTNILCACAIRYQSTEQFFNQTCRKRTAPFAWPAKTNNPET